MNFKTDFITGEHSELEWSGVYGYRPDSHKEFFQFGEMLAVLRLKTEVDGFELERLAKLLMQEVQDSYYNEANFNKKNSLLELLEDSLWKMKSRMEIILSKEEEVMQKGIDLEMAIVTIAKNALFAAVIGESKIFVSRDDNFVDVSEALIDTTMSNFIRSGSLEIEEEDRFILATSKCLSVGHERIQTATYTLNITSLDELNDKSGASLLIFADETLPWIEQEAEGAVIVESEKEENGDIKKDDDAIEKDLLPVEEEYERAKAINEDAFENTESVELTSKNDASLTTANFYFSKAKNKFKGMLSGLKKKEESKEPEDWDLSHSTNYKEESEEEEFTKEHFSKDYGDDRVDRYSELENENKDTSPLAPVKKILSGIGKFIKSIKKNIEKHFRENQTTYVKIIQSVLNFFKLIFGKIKGFFEREILGTSSRKFSNQRKKIQRNRLIFAVVLVVLVYFLYTNISNASQNHKQEQLSEERALKYDQLQQTLDSINTRSASTTNKQGLISELNTLENSVRYEQTASELTKAEKERLNSILLSVQTTEDSFQKITAFTEPQVIADLGAQFPDTRPADLEYAGGYLFITDSVRNVIYRTGTQLQSLLEPFITSNLETPTYLTRNVAGDIIFYDKSETGSSIGKFNPLDATTLVRIGSLVLSDVGIVDEVGIYSGNDSLYEIHNSNKQIFRRDKQGADYQSGGAVYDPNSPPNWKTSSEINSAVDIAIPFEVYILSEGQGLYRYLGGGDNTVTFDVFQDLQLDDFNKFSQASSMDVSLGYLAIGIPGERKIMLFSIEDNLQKTITLVSQFVYRGDGDTLSDINEIVINEQEKKLYVLDNSKVLRFDF